MSYSTTWKSPSGLIFGGKIRSRLDLIFPVQNKAYTNVNNESKKIRNFDAGERVQCRNYCGKLKWCFGKISKRLGKSHYVIKMDDGKF